eukprot:5696642-Alexandrium_andersonii.AAC.1
MAETERAMREAAALEPTAPPPPPPLPHEVPRPAQGFAAADGDGAPPRERDVGPDGPLHQCRGRRQQQQQERQSPPRERSRACSAARRVPSADSGAEPRKHKVVYWTQSAKSDLRWHARGDCRHLIDNAKHRVLPHEGCRGCTDGVCWPGWDAP